MASKCGKCKGKCGCKDSALTIPANFINDPAVCPDPEPCSELFDMDCICYNGPIIVDLDISPGDRMSEILQKLVLSVTHPGCADFGDPAATCLSPLNLAASTITDNSISITWDVDSLSTGYQLEYMQVGAMTWLVNPAVGPTINTDTAGGLLADTYYDFRVLSNCATGGCYSLTIRIKTLPTP